MTSIEIGVIPAAGEGRRFGYLGKILPKPLMPVYDRPIIHLVVDNMKRIGVTKLFVPVYFHKEKIKHYFSESRASMDVEVNLIELDKPTSGIAETISTARDSIKEPFAVILGDDFTMARSFDNLVRTFFNQDAIALEGVVEEKSLAALRSTCCVRMGERNKILEIEEKPNDPKSSLRGCGIYLFRPEIFDYVDRTPRLPPRNEVEITNTIGLVAEEGKAFAELIDGENVNINNYDDLLLAALISFKNTHSRGKMNELLERTTR
jgi:dTDP-glucose pyrophosphorylase